MGWQPATNWGWRGVTEVATGYVSFNTTTQDEGNGCTLYIYSGYIYHDSLGAPHPFVRAAQWRLGIGGRSCTTQFFPPHRGGRDRRFWLHPEYNFRGGGTPVEIVHAKIVRPSAQPPIQNPRNYNSVTFCRQLRRIFVLPCPLLGEKPNALVPYRCSRQMQPCY